MAQAVAVRVRVLVGPPGVIVRLGVLVAPLGVPVPVLVRTAVLVAPPGVLVGVFVRVFVRVLVMVAVELGGQPPVPPPVLPVALISQFPMIVPPDAASIVLSTVLAPRLVRFGGAPVALAAIHDLTRDGGVVSMGAGKICGLNPCSAHWSSKPR